ncbi:MAG TPA: S-layer homology domain-containing protein, partial [Alicyclobacillus sp.]|nr:S-layer homology domain-containing protein [Alicyclobacillus sp.]
IIAGFPDGLFHPDQPLTRGDMAVMVARAMGLL